MPIRRLAVACIKRCREGGCPSGRVIGRRATLPMFSHVVYFQAEVDITFKRIFARGT